MTKPCEKRYWRPTIILTDEKERHVFLAKCHSKGLSAARVLGRMVEGYGEKTEDSNSYTAR